MASFILSPSARAGGKVEDRVQDDAMEQEVEILEPDWLKEAGDTPIARARNAGVFGDSDSDSDGDEEAGKAAVRDGAQMAKPELHSVPCDGDGGEMVRNPIASSGGEDKGSGLGPSGKATEKGRLPLVAPPAERLKRKKFLVECASSRGDNDFADLEGDSGAVGRVIFNGNPTRLAFDLKGVVYDTSLVPSVSMLVINRTAEEARVESVVSSFLRLEEREGQEDVLMAGDFENIGTMNATAHIEDDGDNADEEAPGNVAAKKRAKAAGAGAPGKRQTPKKSASKKTAGGRGGKGAAKKPRAKKSIKMKSAK